MFTPDEEIIEVAEVMLWDSSDKASEFRRKQMLKAIKTVRSTKIKKGAAKIKDKIIEEKGGCEICGFTYKPVLQIHHILPISKYGDNSDDNILCVCPNCHKTLHYMYASSSKESIEDLLDDIASHFWSRYGFDATTKLFQIFDKYVEGCVMAKKYIESAMYENNQLG